MFILVLLGEVRVRQGLDKRLILSNKKITRSNYLVIR